MDLIKHSQLLPEKPTAADTADWYRLGDAVEKHGRHMKRQAVAAEYNSGRDNMAAWYREINISEQVGRELLNECRQVHLVGSVDAVNVSQALPTSKAAREYAKAEPEVREVIKEIIKEDPEAEIKAAEIRKLRAELAEVRAENSHQPDPIVDLDMHRAMTQGMQFGAVIGTFMDNLMSYQLSSRSFLDPEVVARHDVRLNELQAMLERYFNPTINSISPTTIDV